MKNSYNGNYSGKLHMNRELVGHRNTMRAECAACAGTGADLIHHVSG